MRWLAASLIQRNTAPVAAIDVVTLEQIDRLAGASTPIVSAGGSSQGLDQGD